MNIHYKLMAVSDTGIFYNGTSFESKEQLTDVIINDIAFYKEIPKSLLLSRSRKGNLVAIRRVLAYVFHEKLKLSHDRIGKILGGYDHSTSVHHCNFIKERWSHLDQWPLETEILIYLNSKLQIK